MVAHSNGHGVEHRQKRKEKRMLFCVSKENIPKSYFPVSLIFVLRPGQDFLHKQYSRVSVYALLASSSSLIEYTCLCLSNHVASCETPAHFRSESGRALGRLGESRVLVCPLVLSLIFAAVDSAVSVRR